MNRNIVIGIIAVVVIALAGLLAFQELHRAPSNLASASSEPTLPTQSQISQGIAGNWKIISMGEINSSQLLSGMYPNALSLYQEYVELAGSNSTVISISIVAYSGQPNSTTSLPHAVVGHYLVEVNATGNVSPTIQESFLALAKADLTGGNGTKLSVPSFMYPSTSSLPLVEFAVSNLTSQQGNFTQYSAYYLGTTSTSGESLGVDILHGPNSTALYNYLYSTTLIPSNGSTKGSSLAVNGSLNGIKYFNLSVNGTFGQTFYYVGLKGEYVILVQAQPSQNFQAFEYIVDRL
ncbi:MULTISPECIES: hypothetical protein [Metallosphaera]|uniref:hypothetical protein n=2 Tax=Sulfolobaceae TaxID=118883 RepID=UPI002989B16C|nr:hypothetical protein [Metallosphaera sedula]MCP6729914.1 hypothetical protein [Metallosphaera sedula]